MLLIVCLCASPTMAQQNSEQLASYYYQNKEYDKAIELYNTLYQRSKNKYYYQMLYDSYIALNDYKSAIKLVEKRIKQQPKELSLYVDLGQLYLLQDDRKHADKIFRQAIDNIGIDSKQVESLSNAFQTAGLYDYALQTYTTARQRMHNPYAYVMEVAALQERKGDYEAMMQEYFDLLDRQPGMMGSIQLSLQRTLNQTDNPSLVDGLRRALIARVQRDPDNRRYLDMMIWFSLQQKDFAFALTQAQAIDARFPGQGEDIVMQVGQMAQNNGDYDVAYDCYHYITQKGTTSNHYFNARVGELKVKFDKLDKNYHLSTTDYQALKTDYQSALTELGKTVNTIPIMTDYAYLLAYYGNEVQSAADILYDIIEMPKVPPATCYQTKLDLGDLLLFSGNVWDASLLYSQVEKANKNDILGAMAKFKNAKLSYYNHDFEWAKAQLDVLRASTSKLIANDAMELSLLISDNMEEDSTYQMLELYASADLLLYRNQLDSAWEGFNAITQRALSHPLLDDVLMQKAKIRMKQGRYAEADTLLTQLVQLYGDELLADDAVMMLAELNETQLANPEQARHYYEQLILDYPNSLYVDRARQRYNALRKQS